MKLAAFAALFFAVAPAKKELARATALVDQAVALFRAERYVGAAELFLEAYAITDLPVQLRNAAKAFQLGNEEERAIDAWKSYAARTDVSASERAEAQAEIARIEEKRSAREAIRAAEDAKKRAEQDAARAREEAAVAAAERTKTATEAAVATEKVIPLAATRAPDAMRPENTAETVVEERSSGPYYLAGGSAVLAIAATILFAHSSTRLSKLDGALAMTDGRGLVTGVDQTDAVERLDSINSERDAARFVFAAGLATLATGAIWWLVDR